MGNILNEKVTVFQKAQLMYGQTLLQVMILIS